MSHLEIAKQVLSFESSQIQRCIGNLDDTFNTVVENILHTTGKLVICGIGKSGYIAEKIVATLCSTGTQALYLHAGEAAHGDLGIYTAGDPILCISKSGTTEEILRIIPFLKQSGSIIISITGNTQSPIAKQSTYVLNAHVEREADPLNLAPTASTTVALAIGDALAVALMHARGFTEKDFAKYHPGGQLGKNILLRVDDVMHNINAIATVTENQSFRELIIAMTKINLGAACVVDAENNLLGIITDGDVRRSLLHDIEFSDLHIKDIMTKNPICVTPASTLKIAIELMENRPSQLSVLPVVDNKKCLGLIRIHDIYRG